jgi:hypothetical protein
LKIIKGALPTSVDSFVGLLVSIPSIDSFRGFLHFSGDSFGGILWGIAIRKYCTKLDKYKY